MFLHGRGNLPSGGGPQRESDACRVAQVRERGPAWPPAPRGSGRGRGRGRIDPLEEIAFQDHDEKILGQIPRIGDRISEPEMRNGSPIGAAKMAKRDAGLGFLIALLERGKDDGPARGVETAAASHVLRFI